MWAYPKRKASTKDVLDVQDFAEIVQPLADQAHNVGGEHVAAGAFPDRNDLATDSYFRYYESHAAVDSGLTSTAPVTATSGTLINRGVGWQVIESWSKETRGEALRVLYNVQLLRAQNDGTLGVQIGVRVNGALVIESVAPTITLAHDPWANVFPALTAPIARTVVVPNSPGITSVELVVRSVKAPDNAWDSLSTSSYPIYLGAWHLGVIDFVR